MRPAHSASIHSRYDYYCTPTSPESQANLYYDNQNQSLFGDPVQPSMDFLENLDSHLYGSFRQSSSTNRKTVSSHGPIASGCPVSSSSSSGGCINNNVIDVVPSPISTHSFTGDYRQRFRTMVGTDFGGIGSRPYEDRSTILQDEAFLEMQRRSSSAFCEDFRANLDNFRNTDRLPPVPINRIYSGDHSHSRRPSNQSFKSPLNQSTESQSSSDWITGKPSTPINYLTPPRLSPAPPPPPPPPPPIKCSIGEWTGSIPRPKSGRPSKHHLPTDIPPNSDAIEAVIQDSSTQSSSTDEKSPTPYRSPESDVVVRSVITPTIASCTNKCQAQEEAMRIDAKPIKMNVKSSPTPPPLKQSPNVIRKSVTPPPDTVDKGTSTTIDEVSLMVDGERAIQTLSPILVRDTVSIGPQYRQPQPRPIKKSSFAIITELSPNPSRATSPQSGRTSPFRGKGFKSSSRLSSRAASPFDMTQHEGSESSRPSVQFNMTSLPQDNKPHSVSVIPQRGILHHPQRKILSASSTDLSYQDREIESYEIKTDDKHKTLIQIPAKSIGETGSGHSRTFSVIPNLNLNFNSKTSPSPAPRRRYAVYRSTGDLNRTTTEQQDFEAGRFVNPKSNQKGLLHIVNGSPSKIPRRRSLTGSFGSTLNRKKSISDEETGGIDAAAQQPSTMIDLGVTSGSQQPSRSGSRISKPTTLSPIIGTPNKESEQSAQEEEDTKTAVNNTETNGTKIPVRRKSLTLKPGSKVSSREASPAQLNRGSSKQSPNVSRSNSISRNRSVTPSTIKRSSSNRNTIQKSTTPALKPNTFERSSIKKPILSTFKRDPIRTSTKKEAPSARKEPSSVRRETSNIRKVPSSVKREPSSLKRDQPSSIKRETSNVKREGSVKREPSNLKRETSNLKRETSNLKRETSNLKRETSNLKKDQPSDTLKRETSNIQRPPSNLQRQRSNMKRDPTSATSVLSKNNSDSNIGKKLDKKNSLKKDKRRTTSETDITAPEKQTGAGKLMPLTKANVISMTTAAITSQPIEITTTVTNQISLKKTNSTGLILPISSGSNPVENGDDRPGPPTTPAEIIEKSQKTLETIQKAVNEATEEIHKTIEENLTDLKSLENDIKLSTDEVKPIKPVVPFEKKSSSKSIIISGRQSKISEELTDTEVIDGTVVEQTPPPPIDATVSIVNQIGTTSNGSASLKPQDSDERVSERSISAMPEVDLDSGNRQENLGGMASNQSTAKVGSENGSYDDAPVAPGSKCSKCCSTVFCFPCQRLNKTRCCQRCKSQHKPTSNASTTSCWGSMCRKKSDVKQEAMQSEPKPGRCRLCMKKFFCCRKTNQVVDGSDTETDRSCFCIPCHRKPKENITWDNRRASVMSGPNRKRGCCARLCDKLLCRKPPPPDSRRPSQVSKKQSLATSQPPEDNRPKLNETLIEHGSMMKGAIPILPLCLAWFCLICNCIVPGLGTILSGILCLCFGIPRFSQHDSIRARIGAFVINCIVGVSQAFTVLFCLVGWGWSIWWGTIMLKVSKKMKRIRTAEEADLQEEQTTSSNRTSNPPIINHRDIEAGRT